MKEYELILNNEERRKRIIKKE